MMLVHSSTPRKRTRDPLGRYYTKQKVSEILVDGLSLGKSSKLLDLGSGDGALSNAARGQWSDIEVVTVDVDRRPIYFGDKKHKHFLCDALGSELPSFLKEVGYVPDVAVCNPPFIKTEWRDSFSEILEQSNLSGSYKFINEAATEALFLAQNLRLVKPGGEVGIIVPDGIVSGKKHLGFRKKLLEKHCLRSVTKLPKSAFLGTDAQAYILIIKEGGGTLGDVILGEIDDQGNLAESCLIESEQCLERLDYGFHSTIKAKKKTDRTLGELATYIGRGAFSSSDRKRENFKIFHTTDFPTGKEANKFEFPSEFSVPSWVGDKYKAIAMPGDILLARVGRNLEEKICYVESGMAAVSDCVYIIRSAKNDQQKIYKNLITYRGKAMLKKLAHGVSAKQLAKKDLCQFPVEV